MQSEVDLLDRPTLDFFSEDGKSASKSFLALLG